MNYNKIKQTLFISVLLIGLLTGCAKKLDIEPVEEIDATTAITNTNDAEAAIVGCYSILAGPSLYGTSLLMDADLLASTGYCSFVGTFGQFRQISGKTMNRDNTDIARVWRRAYQAINMANILLESSSVITDPAKKNTLEGEALMIRALMHFELVRFYALPWGATAGNDHLGIVIKTTASRTEASAAEIKPRNNVAQVYASIIADLTAAIAKLPVDNGTRADRYTALAYLSRVYLQQGDYTKALSAANQVILSGKYAMNASLNAVFDNKNTDESIIEIQQNEQNNAGSTNDGMATFFASIPGIGRGDFRVSATFLGLYPSGDARRSQWYYIGTGERPGSNNCSKWKSFSQNLPLVRIAEMYLTRAECNVRLGTSVGDTPQNDLAKIRNPLRTTTAVIVSPNLNDILSERYLELAFEGIRIHDVKRLQGVTGTFSWNNNRLVFPIPQREVNATNGIVVQNPGY